MRKVLQIIGIVCVGILAVMLLAIGAGYMFLQSDFLRNEAQSRVGVAIGRETTIGGAEIDWG